MSPFERSLILIHESLAKIMEHLCPSDGHSLILENRSMKDLIVKASRFTSAYKQFGE